MDDGMEVGGGSLTKMVTIVHQDARVDVLASAGELGLRLE